MWRLAGWCGIILKIWLEAACVEKSGVKYFYATQELIQHVLAPGSGYEREFQY